MRALIDPSIKEWNPRFPEFVVHNGLSLMRATSSLLTRKVLMSNQGGYVRGSVFSEEIKLTSLNEPTRSIQKK